MTVSLVGRCAETGMMGVVIASSSPAVAARCAFARAGVGAVATQNVTDPRLGPAVLDRLAGRQPAPDAVDGLIAATPAAEYRQLLAIDANGRVGVHTGARSLGIAAAATGRDCAAAGNLLSGTDVPHAMASAFEAARGVFGGRLIAALEGARDAGGEAGPMHSAGLLVVREVSWPIADLRVDWSDDCPVAALAALWARYVPQLEDYVTRALDPSAAPSYGVPGDE